MGVCYQTGYSNFPVFVILMVLIGVGSIGYYGLVFLSLTESYYPLSSLLIGTLICVGASLYSALATALGSLPFFNPFFVLAAVAFLPWVYLLITFRTDFKRYRYYMDEKLAKFTLLKVDDAKSIFNSSRKY